LIASRIYRVGILMYGKKPTSPKSLAGSNTAKLISSEKVNLRLGAIDELRPNGF
jgi:hypothetical protein